jgi:hypothetical protein
MSRIEDSGMQLIEHAQQNMRDGVLHLTGTATGERTGKLRYTGVYLPKDPIAITHSQFADFAPGQPALIREHVEFYSEEFNEGENAQISPIEVAPTVEGQLTVVDGHHRLAAGLSLGKPIPLVIDPDTEPPHASNWNGVEIKEEDSDALAGS